MAIPIPITPNAKNPGTILRTVEPQLETDVKLAVDAVAVLTSVAIGPIKDEPINILTKPPMRFAIIVIKLFQPV